MPKTTRKPAAPKPLTKKQRSDIEIELGRQGLYPGVAIGPDGKEKWPPPTPKKRKGK